MTVVDTVLGVCGVPDTELARETDLSVPCAVVMRVGTGGGEAGMLETASLPAMLLVDELVSVAVMVAVESLSATGVVLVAAVLVEVEEVIDDASDASEEFIATEVGSPAITRRP